MTTLNETCRIKSSYKRSSGDSGKSLLFNGHSLQKNHPAASIYSECESLAYAINKFLLKNELKYTFLGNTLDWLKRNSFSLGAFVFSLGDSERHSIPNEVMNQLEASVLALEDDQQIGSAIDFVMHNKELYVDLDGIRIIIRKTEAAYTTWNQDWIVNEHLLKVAATNPEQAQKIAIARQEYAAYLNRLSKFIWLATRREAQLAGDFDTQHYWTGRIE